MFPEEKFREAEEQTIQFLSLLKIKNGRILDLCCGPGRFAIPFARQGFTVTAVDRTEFLLDKARQKADSEKLNINFIQSDMREFIQLDSFEIVLNLFTSFGYFENINEDLNVVKNVYASLKSEDRFLIDLMGKEVLAMIYQLMVAHKLGENVYLIQKPEIVDDWTRVRNEWILIENGNIMTMEFHHTIFSGKELKDLLLKVGLKNIQLAGDLSGSVYDANAGRLIGIATK